MKNFYSINSMVVDNGQVDTIRGHFCDMPAKWQQMILDRIVHEQHGQLKGSQYSEAYKAVRAELADSNPPMQVDMKHANCYDPNSAHDRAIPVNRRGRVVLVGLTYARA